MELRIGETYRVKAVAIATWVSADEKRWTRKWVRPFAAMYLGKSYRMNGTLFAPERVSKALPPFALAVSDSNEVAMMMEVDGSGRYRTPIAVFEKDVFEKDIHEEETR